MDEYLNNRHNEILWNLLTDPVNNGHTYAPDLHELVDNFPQCGVLYALLSHADNGQNIKRAAVYINPKVLFLLMNSPENLAEVSDAQIIQQPGNAVEYGIAGTNNILSEPENSIQQEKASASVIIADDEQQEVEAIYNHTETEQTKDPSVYSPELDGDETEPVITAPAAEDEEHTDQITITPENQNFYEDELVTEAGGAEEEQPETNLEQEPDTVTEEHGNYPADEFQLSNEQHEEIVPVAEMPEDERVTHATHFEDEQVLVAEKHDQESNEEPVITEISDEHAAPATSGENIRQDELLTETPVFELTQPPRDIDDDVYDEIVGIEDISFTQVNKPVAEVSRPEEAPSNEEELPQATTHEQEPVQKERMFNMSDEAEKLIVGNIAATDYFVFDRAFNDRKQTEAGESNSTVAASGLNNEPVVTNSVTADEKQEVSKYDDDTLPYTFMWWLNKTRKEHAGIYQPFKLDTSLAIRRHGADELQQQYYENIFHLNSVEELDRSTQPTPIEFDIKNKEDRIIKRFIVEEPHISTPSSDKLDTENKAKKSSEDQGELVTETLARIYTDQMLYHKAINTYKKLMLKFPEKSRYFADQIQQLENRTN